MLVDGYNVINAWNDVFDLVNQSLEDCRDRLLYILSDYQGFKRIRVIVVFDAYMVKKGQKKEESFDNLQIIYTKENQSADIYIERFVYENSKDNVIRVVTSDYLEQRIVLQGGGARMTPRELKIDIEEMKRTVKSKVDRVQKVGNTNTIMSNINPELVRKFEEMRRGK